MLERGEVVLISRTLRLRFRCSLLNAVVGIKGFFDDSEASSTSVGITCALCHSTVDDSLALGIGARLDGWANRDLNVGAIVALAPSVAAFARLLGVDEPTVREVFQSWGPGEFDAEQLLDGKAFQPDGRSAATLLPPAFGLAGVNLHTYTGWGSVSHWNAFVAVLEMHGKGTFYDLRSNDASRFPIAAANGFADVRREPDLVTPKLPRCTSISSRSRRRSRRRAASTRVRRAAARRCLRPTARPAARRVTCRRSTRSPAATSTRRKTLGSTPSRRSADRRTAIARRRFAASGRTGRVASTTTAASRRCAPSSTTTTRFRARAERQEKRDLVEFLKSL